MLPGKKQIEVKVEDRYWRITTVSMSIVFGLILIGCISLDPILLDIPGLFQKISQLTPLLKQIGKSSSNS